MSEMTFKLYSPLTAELLSDGSEYWNDTDSIVLRGYELTDYVEAITAQIAEEGTNIEQYMDAEDDPYLAAHVKSIRLSVAEFVRVTSGHRFGGIKMGHRFSPL